MKYEPPKINNIAFEGKLKIRAITCTSTVKDRWIVWEKNIDEIGFSNFLFIPYDVINGRLCDDGFSKLFDDHPSPSSHTNFFTSDRPSKLTLREYLIIKDACERLGKKYNKKKDILI